MSTSNKFKKDDWSGAIKAIWRKGEELVYHQYLRVMGRISSRVITRPFEVVWVPVDSINYAVDSKRFSEFRLKRLLFGQVRTVGRIRGGDWDVTEKKFTDKKTFEEFRERFLEDRAWEETTYYERFFADSLSKTRMKKCKNWEEYKKRYLIKWEDLCQEIKKNGYKSQKELNRNPKGEIEVAVSRNREILFVDGGHRLSIVKILGIKEVPVIVNLWHKEYIDWVGKKCGPKKVTPKEAMRLVLEGKYKTQE